MNYNYNISTWITRNLPQLRKVTSIQVWLSVLLTPLQTLANDFKAVSDDLDNKVKYSGQQKLLAHILNNLFDNSLRRIRIETVSDRYPAVVLWFDSELPEGPIIAHDFESYTGPLLVHDAELSPFNYRVIVPVSLSASETQIIAWVNRYNTATKTFIIQYE